jgi:hypothetical protein
MKNWHVDQTSLNLFGALPNEYLRHIVRGNENYYAPSGGGWSYAVQLSPSFRRFLLRKLYWFKGLKKVHKNKLYSMCTAASDFQKLSNLMQSVEGRVIAGLLSVGDRVSYEDIDALNVSIMSNLLNDSRYQKKMKTYLKRVRKSFLEGNPIPKPERHTSFLYAWVKKCVSPENVDTDEGAYRLTTFCQGRAMGNPTGALILDSARKWVENFTTPDPHDPDNYNLEELEIEVTGTPVNIEKVRAHARITLSTSACYEVGRKDGGKLAYARKILEIPQIRRIDLNTGEDSPETVLSRKFPGEALFHHSLWKMRDEFKIQMSVRASNVNEGGAKSRVVTADTFAHGCVLSPWAHMWLKVLQKFPAANAGVTEGRHGWTFIKSITASRPDLSWVFDLAVQAISTDLSEATDHLFWSAAEALINMCNRVLELPEWYGRLITRCLCSPRYVKYRAGSFSWEGETTNGVFMGDSGCKVLLTMGNLLAVIRMGVSTHSVSAVVGDDHTSISSNAAHALEVYKRSIRLLGFVTSDDDEVISDRYGFYAEELYTIPNTARDTVDAIFIPSSPREFPYIDVPKVRLLMDIRKDRKDFASTAVGRIFQFGREMEYCNRPNRYQALTHIGSWIQDHCLDLRHKPEFVYFPRSLVGGGKPILFQNRNNFVDFVHLHKRGRLLRRYYYLMDQAAHSGMNLGIIPRFFTKTNEDRLVIVRQRELPEEIIRLRLFQSRKKKWYQPLAVQRLTKYIISETEILSRLNQLEELFSEVPVAQPATVENVAIGGLEGNPEIIETFLDMWEGNSMLMGRHAQENWYPREEVLEFLDLRNPLHVDIPIKWRGAVGDRIPADRQLERERHEAALYDWVLSTADGEPPTDIIADDPAIINSIRNVPFQDVYIVTRDWELLKYAASMYWRKRIYMIDPLRWFEAGLTISPLLGVEVQDSVIIDQGALDAAAIDLEDEADRIMQIQIENSRPLTFRDLKFVRATNARTPREIHQGNLLYKIWQENFAEEEEA